MDPDEALRQITKRNNRMAEIMIKLFPDPELSLAEVKDMLGTHKYYDFSTYDIEGVINNYKQATRSTRLAKSLEEAFPCEHVDLTQLKQLKCERHWVKELNLSIDSMIRDNVIQPYTCVRTSMMLKQLVLQRIRVLTVQIEILENEQHEEH